MDKLTDADGNITHVNGMTLRDYFAGQAISSLITSGIDEGDDPKLTAKWCYAFADMMIEARK